MSTENIKIDFDTLFKRIVEEEISGTPNILGDVNENLVVGDDEDCEVETPIEKQVLRTKDDVIKTLQKAEKLKTKSPSNSSGKRKPAWEDTDDEEYHVEDVIKENKRSKYTLEGHAEKTYKEYLTRKFAQVAAAPKWAELDREIDPDSEDEILKTVGHLKKSSSSALPANNISLKKLKDLNRDTYAEKSITSVQFHPLSTAALVTGYSGVVSIYAVDGKRNEKLHNAKFQKYPISCARIVPDGTEALLGGPNKYFYAYDLLEGRETRINLPKTITKMTQFELSPCGKYFAIVGRFGEVHLMDLKSKELIHTFKQENQCTSLQFIDSNKIITHSDTSDVNILDLRLEKVEHTFLDEGCISGRAISISKNGQLLATGSNEGVVNIYSYNDVVSSSSPSPQKVIYNLTTTISMLKFNHSAEILGASSDAVAGAAKLIHFPSGTVFRNFPGADLKIGKVRLMEFSPNSGFMALGTAGKEVSLYRLKHFNNY